MDSALSDSDSFEIIDQVDAALEADDITKIQAWLQPTEYQAESSEYNRHLSSQAPGTGLWLCETSQFQQWHNSERHGSLWIKGTPGAGKSVVAASMIEYLTRTTTEDVPVLYFFFRYVIVRNRRPRGLIQDFLAQLLQYSPQLQATLHVYSGVELDEVSDERLWEFLMLGLASVRKAYCVVDAMDEMEALLDDPFFNRLNSLATFQPDSIKLLMTSRPKQYLQRSLRDASIVHISLEDDLVGKDIALFTSFRLRNAFPGLENQQLRDSLSSIICERSRGLFLYSRLLIDQIIPILHTTHDLDVAKLACSLPVGLEEMYNNMLVKQAESVGISNKIQVFLLELVTHSSRALRLNELANALAFAFQHVQLPGTSKSIARSACAPLLEVLEDEAVQVIHHSFTEFLLDTSRTNSQSGGTIKQFPVINPVITHMRIATICLAYLQSGVLKEQDLISTESKYPNECDLRARKCIRKRYQKDPDNIRKAKLNHPFLEYAITNWAHHCGLYDVEDGVFFNTVTEFLSPANIDFQKWLLLEWTSKVDLDRERSPTPLHVASFAGMSKYVARLISAGSSLEALDFDDRTALHWACRRGHSGIVSLLLKDGAEPDAEDCRGVKPIHEAAKRNHSGIVAMLLDAGVDPLTPKTRNDHNGPTSGGETLTRGETAVEYACVQGHTETILAMLPFIQQATLQEVLGECCQGGRFEAVRAVLENTSVSPNAKFCGATGLYLACQARSVKCVELLLEKGADVNMPSDPNYFWKKRGISMGSGRAQSRLPVHAIAWELGKGPAAQKILRLLCSAGADVEAKAENGDTVLTQLFQEGPTNDVASVKILLGMGARATPELFHRCVSTCRNIEILELVLANGVDVNVSGLRGDTALHLLLSRAYCRNNGEASVYELVKFLLQRGARPDILNEEGQSALQKALCTPACGIDTFRLLLQACPDPSLPRLCLWHLEWRTDVEESAIFAKELLAFGAVLEDTNSQGQTVLLASAHSDKAFEALVRCGANVNSVDSKGRGVLHQFVGSNSSRYYPERLEEFIAMGMNPLAVDAEKNNLLHLYAVQYVGSKEEVQLVQKLISYGVDANAKNLLGATALHIDLESVKIGSFNHEQLLIPLGEVLQRSQGDFDINAQDQDGASALHLAALLDEVKVSQILAAGADLSTVTNDGRTALHVACRARQSNIVSLLASKAKSLINTKDKFGRSPLHDACTSGRPESVWILLKAGANINAVDNMGRTSLHSCAEFEPEKQVWNLLKFRNEAAEQYTRPDRWRPRAGTARVNNPWYASEHVSGSPISSHDTARIAPIVDMLLAAGADAHRKDSKGVLPLDLAIMFNCTEMVQKLQFTIGGYKEMRDLNPDGHILETLAALNSPRTLEGTGISTSTYEQLLQHPQIYLPLLTPAEMLSLLPKTGNIVSQPGASGDHFMQQLLHLSADQGLHEVFESLGAKTCIDLDYESLATLLQQDASKSGYEFEPILYIACDREIINLQVIDVLINKCGVNINHQAIISNPDYTGEKYIPGPTALHHLAYANSWWHIEAIRLLVAAGADINSLDEKGQTPLHIASFGDKSLNSMNSRSKNDGHFKLEAVNVLLELGADPDILDEAGKSCLSKVDSSPKIARLLLQYSSNKSAQMLSSALFCAIRTQDAETIAILVDAGADSNSVDTEKVFPLHYRSETHTRFALFCACYSNVMNRVEKDPTPILRVLLERGADPYAALNEEETLIHFVLEHSSYEIVSSIIEIMREENVQLNLEQRDQQGRTLLLAGCNWGECLPGYRHEHWEPKAQAPFIDLLDLGVDTSATDLEGRHMLHYLLSNPDMEVDAILHFLSAHTAKALLLRKDNKGFSPIHCALQCLRPNLIEVLLAMGADLMEADPDGKTALHHIAGQCLQKYVPMRVDRLLAEHKPEYQSGLLALWNKYLQHGGDINARSNTGATPLLTFLASPDQRGDEPRKFCHVEYYSKLFDSVKVDVQARNKDGETGLHVIAKREGDFYTAVGHDAALFALMVKRGLDPLAEDAEGRSALDIAAACGKKEILEMFRFGKG